MNASTLKREVEKHLPLFFSRKTMQFFGDTMKNYRVRSNYINSIAVWELYRKRPVKHNLTSSVYFDKKTFKRVNFINNNVIL